MLHWIDDSFCLPGIAVYDPEAIHSDTQYAYIEPVLYSDVLSVLQSQEHTIYDDIDDCLVDSEYSEIGIPSVIPPHGAAITSVDIAIPTQKTLTTQLNQELLESVKKAPIKECTSATKIASLSWPRYKVRTQKAKYPNPPPLPEPVTDPEEFKLPPRKPLRKPSMEPNKRTFKGDLYSNEVPRSAVTPTSVKIIPMKPYPLRKENTLIREVHNSDDVALLTVYEVTVYLKMLKLDDYINLFKEHMVDGNILLALDINILKEDFHMKRIEALRLIKFANEGHLPK